MKGYGESLRTVRGPARQVGNVEGLAVAVLLMAALEFAVRALNLEASVARPSAVVRAAAAEFASGELPRELATTLQSYGAGIVAASLAAVAVGALMGASRTVERALALVVELLRPIPSVALIPLAIMFFGLGMPMRRFIVAYVAFWPILLNTFHGVRSTDRMLIDVARTAGVSRLGQLLRVRLPAAAPSIATGIRVSASIGLLAGVTAELITGNDGLGAYLMRQQLAYHLPELYAGIVVTGVLGYAIAVALRFVERRVVFWGAEKRIAAL